MNPSLFNDLISSIREAGAIQRGEAEASRRFEVAYCKDGQRLFTIYMKAKTPLERSAAFLQWNDHKLACHECRATLDAACRWAASAEIVERRKERSVEDV